MHAYLANAISIGHVFEKDNLVPSHPAHKGHFGQRTSGQDKPLVDFVPTTLAADGLMDSPVAHIVGKFCQNNPASLLLNDCFQKSREDSCSVTNVTIAVFMRKIARLLHRCPIILHLLFPFHIAAVLSGIYENVISQFPPCRLLGSANLSNASFVLHRLILNIRFLQSLLLFLPNKQQR